MWLVRWSGPFHLTTTRHVAVLGSVGACTVGTFSTSPPTLRRLPYVRDLRMHRCLTHIMETRLDDGKKGARKRPSACTSFWRSQKPPVLCACMFVFAGGAAAASATLIVNLVLGQAAQVLRHGASALSGISVEGHLSPVRFSLSR